MSKKLNVPDNKLHESAEKMEHILEERFWNRIADDLGNPEIDPHGSPIPKLGNLILDKEIISLGEAQLHKEYVVTTNQKNIDYLWHLGLVPNSRVVILDKNSQCVKVWHFNQNLEISNEIAKELMVRES
ncbi:MAG: iron dependent repressor, metal binding and dimerization domain protein, partial [Cytophagales bacterium]